MSKTSTSNFGLQPEYSNISRNSLSGGSGVGVVSLDTAANGTATLTANHIASGVLLHTGSVAVNVNTPSAADIANLCGNRVGNSIQYHHRKAGTGTATYVAGSGVTLVDTPAITVGSSKSILMVLTAANPAAVSVYTL